MKITKVIPLGVTPKARLSHAHATHLSLLSDERLSMLRTQLIDTFDAHRDTRCDTGKPTKIDPELRSYYEAVRIEYNTRLPHWITRQEMAQERYESRKPVNVLKRAIDSTQSGGNTCFADLQATYMRERS